MIERILSKQGCNKLRAVKDHILEEPRRLNMGSWMDKAEWHPHSDQSFVDNFNKDLGHTGFAPCGTAACIAGWLCILDGREQKVIESYSIREAASKILGFETPHLIVGLFYVDSWDEPFHGRYMGAGSIEEKAQVAADYIDHYIKTRGPEDAEQSEHSEVTVG